MKGLMALTFALAFGLTVACTPAAREVDAHLADAAPPTAGLPDLRPPNVGRAEAPAGSEPAIAAALDVLDCRELAMRAGFDDLPTFGAMLDGELPHRRECALEYRGAGPLPGSSGLEQPFTLHVLQLPDGFDVNVGSLTDLVDAGGLWLFFTVRGPGDPAHLPSEADPDQPAGGYAPFEVRGQAGLVQRVGEDVVTATWYEDSGPYTDVRFSLRAGGSPQQVVESVGGLVIPAPSPAGTASGEPVVLLPATDTPNGQEAADIGRLAGDAAFDGGCVWLEVAQGERQSVVWPPGYAVRFHEAGFDLLAANGEVVAKSGDTLLLGGGFGSYPGMRCDVDGDGEPFVAGTVTVEGPAS